jgi:hypothetical protein
MSDPKKPIPGYVVGQYFGIFNGVSKTNYEAIVNTAPFETCNLLILAFVWAFITSDGTYAAQFKNWRDDNYNNSTSTPDDTDQDRVQLVVRTARAKNPGLKILISLGWGDNDTGHAATTPKQFADSVASIVQTYELDGFDIDYESVSVEADAMRALVSEIRNSLQTVKPGRDMIMTITPAQVEGLNAEVLGLFDYTMPQTYKHGGNGTKVDWFKEQLRSFDRIVFGLNSEGYIGESDAPQEFVDQAKSNGAAGIFAWRLDNDSVNEQTKFPTFATAKKMWGLIH